MNDSLQPNEILFVNQMLTSASGEYMLTLQADSNLVLLEKVQHEDKSTTLDPIWTSDTFDRDVWYAMMRPDGNFVLCDYDGDVVWESDTNIAGSFLELRDDGRLVINAISPIWEAAVHDEEEEQDDEVEEMDLGAAEAEAMAAGVENN